jgi:16S rRNA (guanine527-N7)-methyltransferase
VIDRLGMAAGLQNAGSVAERAETWAAGEGREAYDAVTVRALAPLAVLLEYAAPLLRPEGVLVAWKGARDDEEERAADRASRKLGMDLTEVRAVKPFEGVENRHLHTYAKTGATPQTVPRRPGMAKKRPLG